MKVIELAFTVNPVTDLRRARDFYERVLSLEPAMTYEGEGTRWVEYEIGSGALAIGSGAKRFKPSVHGSSAALEMEEFDGASRELKAKESSFAFEPIETPVCH